MEKKSPSIKITPKEFYQLIIDKIQNPEPIPEGSWLPPEILIEGYVVNNKISVQDQLVFENIQLEKIRLRFVNCILKGKYIFNSFNIWSLSFYYTEIDVLELLKSTIEVFNFKFCTSLVLTFHDVHFKQFLSLGDSVVANNIGIEKVEAKGQIGITNVSSNYLSIKQSKSRLNFCNGKYNDVVLFNNNFSSAKIFSSNNKPLSVLNPLQISNDNIDYKYGKLELGPDFNISAIIKGKNKINFNIDELEIKNTVLSNVRVTIDQINVNSISFIGFINTGQLDLFNIIFNSEMSSFNIENSFLGQTKLFNFKLPKNLRFKFISSDIREISYNNVNWPDNLSKENIEDQLELYRQLKHVANINNDTINSVRFYSIEKKSFNKILKWTLKDSGTKLIFFLNNISNDNNLSWIKPIGWNLVIQFILFLMIGIDLSFNCKFDILRFKEFMNPISKFLFLLYPTFNADFIDPKLENHNIAILIVTISRIVSAYLIYQTIAAYRRYK